ncbi:MAG: HPr family phosphocarrier protein [Xanthomonadales bacterium]|nr:HPr family phosphocarrier protein [Xanthomonadales bacterium]
MKAVQTRIVNKLGLHARAATQLVNCASAFASEVWISYGGRRVNGKSIMGVLTLAATVGSEVTVEADGPDEAVAVEAVVELIQNRFNEDE